MGDRARNPRQRWLENGDEVVVRIPLMKKDWHRRVGRDIQLRAKCFQLGVARRKIPEVVKAALADGDYRVTQQQRSDQLVTRVGIFSRVMRVYAGSRKELAGMAIRQLRGIDIALVAATGHDQPLYTSGCGPLQNVRQVVGEAVVRQIRTDINQRKGHQELQPFGGLRYLKITLILIGDLTRDELTMKNYFSKSTITVSLLTILALTVAAPASAHNVNKSVKIGAGSTSDGESSVNGSISVGSGAIVTGDLDTVNGRVRIESDATVEDVSTVNGGVRIDSGSKTESLSTVNGAITVADNVNVDGEIEAVNGEIELGAGSEVRRNVSNVNGEIDLRASKVGGDVSTISGDIKLSESAEVMGDIIIEKPNGWGWNEKKSRTPEVVIGPGSKVHGEIRVERVVTLYISDTAEVGGVTGEMSMDDAVRFSGKKP
jgi:hypothetical protein